MIKKIFIYIVIFIITFPYVCFADEIENEELDFSSLEVSNHTSVEPTINSKYAIIIEKSTKTVLYEKSGYTKTPMASTTKIMTAIIAIENCELNESVKISKKAASTGGSTLGIKSDTTLSMETLLYGLLLRSGNDCAVAIAEHIAGNVESFSNLMNEKAKELNLINSHFITPHGLDSDNHFTTAYDLAILTIYALQNKTFSTIVNTKSSTIDMNGYPRDIHNTHELLGYTEGVYGVKTGFTGNAGRCLVTACKRNNLDIIIVVLGADTKKIRTQDTLNLINYAYNNFEMIDTSEILKDEFKKNISEIAINNSQEKAKLILNENPNYVYPIRKNEKNFSSSIYILENPIAPIEKNTKLGVIKLLLNGYTLYEVDILSEEYIPEITYLQYLNIIIEKIKQYF